MAETTLKTYRARTMAEALSEVKRDLGADAVIIRTRSFKMGGVLGFGARPVVEITASSGDFAGMGAGERRGKAKTRERSGAPKPAGAPRPKIDAIVGDVNASGVYSLSLPTPIRPAGEGGGAGGNRGDAGALSRGDEFETELRAIKRMMGQVLRTSRLAGGAASGAPTGASAGLLPDPLFEQYLRLIEAEVSSDIVEQVVGEVRTSLTCEELNDEEVIRRALLERLAGLAPEGGDVEEAPGRVGGRPYTVALVGPTGVGKTTTVAKLAANYRLRQGLRVGLVTTDTFRIAAVEQLRTYAEIIGAPLRVALTPEEMVDSCAALSDCDVALIDTAGRSPNDAERLAELAAFLDAAKPHTTHLLLSSTASEATLTSVANRFAAVRPNRVIFTKLDEAVNYGVLLSVAHRLRLRLSYLTTGQEVPDHIEAATPERLARLALGVGADAGARGAQCAGVKT